MVNTATPRARALDRAKVAGRQEREVRYKAGKTGASLQKVMAAVKSAGNSRQAVEKELGK